MSEKTYFVPMPSSGDMVRVKEGAVGYWESGIGNDKAKAFNESQGYSEADIETALLCSMFGGWDKFEEKKAAFEAAGK